VVWAKLARGEAATNKPVAKRVAKRIIELVKEWEKDACKVNANLYTIARQPIILLVAYLPVASRYK
jgi:hypothetical protein